MRFLPNLPPNYENIFIIIWYLVIYRPLENGGRKGSPNKGRILLLSLVTKSGWREK